MAEIIRTIPIIPFVGEPTQDQYDFGGNQKYVRIPTPPQVIDKLGVVLFTSTTEAWAYQYTVRNGTHSRYGEPYTFLHAIKKSGICATVEVDVTRRSYEDQFRGEAFELDIVDLSFYCNRREAGHRGNPEGLAGSVKRSRGQQKVGEVKREDRRLETHSTALVKGFLTANNFNTDDSLGFRVACSEGPFTIVGAFSKVDHTVIFSHAQVHEHPQEPDHKETVFSEDIRNDDLVQGRINREAGSAPQKLFGRAYKRQANRKKM